MFNKDSTPGARGIEPPPPARVPGVLAKESHVATAPATGDEEFSMVSPSTRKLIASSGVGCVSFFFCNRSILRYILSSVIQVTAYLLEMY